MELSIGVLYIYIYIFTVDVCIYIKGTIGHLVEYIYIYLNIMGK